MSNESVEIFKEKIEEDRNDQVRVKEREKIDEPPKYAVIFFNDDFTPMDFVIELLQKHFGHGLEQATFIMLDVHEKGKGVAGVYSKDIAETKAARCNLEARAKEHPLSVIFEPQS